jgi:nucleoid DNA-binding protein
MSCLQAALWLESKSNLASCWCPLSTSQTYEQLLYVYFDVCHCLGGRDVSIAGFGVFERRTRAASTGRNPKTGEALQLEASATAGFRISAAFKKQVKEGK